MVKGAVVKNNVDNVVEKALDLLGLPKIIKPSDRVLIKPNIVRPAKPEEGITTHPFLVKQIIRWVKKFTPREIIILLGRKIV